MKVVVSIGFVVLVAVAVNQAARRQSSGERRRNGLENYGYSLPQLESSIETYGEYYEPCAEGDCKSKTSVIPATYLLSQFLIGSYFLLSALICALFNTCTSYPTVTFTTSVTVTNTLTTTTTSPTTTTTRTSSTTPTTKTTTKRTRSTTILPTTFTSISITKFRTTTTTFPTTTTTTTRTTPTTTTTTPISTTVTDTITTSTSTRTQSNNGNGRGLVELDSAFWREILSPDDAEEFFKDVNETNVDFTEIPISPTQVVGTTLFTAVHVQWDPDGIFPEN